MGSSGRSELPEGNLWDEGVSIEARILVENVEGGFGSCVGRNDNRNEEWSGTKD